MIYKSGAADFSTARDGSLIFIIFGQDAVFVVLEPDHRWLALWVLHPNKVELALNLACEALAKAFHIFSSIQIDKFYLGCKWTKRHSFVEFSLYQLNLDQLDNTITVHVRKLVVAIDAEVGTD